MPEPIDLQFDKISMSSSESQTSKHDTKENKEIGSYKKLVFLPGNWTNLKVNSWFQVPL